MTEQKLTLNKIDRLKSIVAKSIGYRAIGSIAALLALTGVAICNITVPSEPSNAAATATESFTPQTLPIVNKQIVAMYFSRFLAGENKDEQSVRSQVRYYQARGINTLIVGVWGNGCAMYHSKVTTKLFGQSSCSSTFQAQWLDWTIDEAHKQGMQVHGYFERGIKIDSSSPIYNLAVTRNWLVPGVDRTYPGMDQRVFDVENPAVVNLYHNVMTEFVTRYPKIDAVQWDDFLAYSVTLPGENRTAKLTKFVNDLIKTTKQSNPKVSFDLCNLNPSWSKAKYSADWKQWHVDRTFVEVYNEPSFEHELATYAEKSDGIAITDQQFNRLPELIENEKIKSILILPLQNKQRIAANNFRLAVAK
jgi:uncharacterized lipoprotein YddW (UPF0748 family)